MICCCEVVRYPYCYDMSVHDYDIVLQLERHDVRVLMLVIPAYSDVTDIEFNLAALALSCCNCDVFCYLNMVLCNTLQCFDAVGWASGRASGL